MLLSPYYFQLCSVTELRLLKCFEPNHDSPTFTVYSFKLRVCNVLNKSALYWLKCIFQYYAFLHETNYIIIPHPSLLLFVCFVGFFVGCIVCVVCLWVCLFWFWFLFLWWAVLFVVGFFVGVFVGVLGGVFCCFFVVVFICFLGFFMS